MTATELAPIAERAAAPADGPLPTGTPGLTWRPLTPDGRPGADPALSRGRGGRRRAVPDLAPRRSTRSSTATGRTRRATRSPASTPTASSARTRASNQPPGDTARRARVPRRRRRPAVARPGDRAPGARLAGGPRAPAARRDGQGACPGRLGVFTDDDAEADRPARCGRRVHAGPVLLRDASLAGRRAARDRGRPTGLRIVPWTRGAATSRCGSRTTRRSPTTGGASRGRPRTWAQGRSMFAPTWSFVAVDEATGEVAGYLLSGRYEQDWPVVGLHLGLHRAARRAARVARAGARAGAAGDRDARRTGRTAWQYAELGVDTANPSGAHGLYAAARLRGLPRLDACSRSSSEGARRAARCGAARVSIGAADDEVRAEAVAGRRMSGARGGRRDDARCPWPRARWSRSSSCWSRRAPRRAAGRGRRRRGREPVAAHAARWPRCSSRATRWPRGSPGDVGPRRARRLVARRLAARRCSAATPPSSRWSAASCSRRSPTSSRSRPTSGAASVLHRRPRAAACRTRVVLVGLVAACAPARRRACSCPSPSTAAC